MGYGLLARGSTHGQGQVGHGRGLPGVPYLNARLYMDDGWAHWGAGEDTDEDSFFEWGDPYYRENKDYALWRLVKKGGKVALALDCLEFLT